MCRDVPRQGSCARGDRSLCVARLAAPHLARPLPRVDFLYPCVGGGGGRH